MHQPPQKKIKVGNPNNQLGAVQGCPLQHAQQFNAPRLEFVRTVADQNAATSVRIGLWDDAWDANNGALFNGDPQAGNFIDQDSRHFYIRVFDDHAAAHNQASVAVSWWTRRTDALNQNAVGDDDRPLGSIVVLERVGNTSEYRSPALMLVTDDEDRDQDTHTGVQNGQLVQRGAVGHRLRRVTVSARYRLDGQVRASYAHNTPNQASPVVTDVDVFAQNEKHRIRVTFVCVRTRVGGACTTTAADLTRYENRLHAIYGRCGIYAEVARIPLNPPAACMGWAGRIDQGEDPAVVVASQERSQNPIQIVPHPTQTALIDAVRQLQNQHQKTIYVFFVANIYDMLRRTPPNPQQQLPEEWFHAGGEAFYPSQATPPAPNNVNAAVQDLDAQIQAERLAEEIFVMIGSNPNHAVELQAVLDGARAAAALAGDDMVQQATAFWNHVDAARQNNQTTQAVQGLLQQAQQTAGQVAYAANALAQTMTDAHRCAFVVQQQYLGNDFAPAHEITHITTNENNEADGHFDLGQPNDAHPGHIDGRNLMHRYALDDGPGGNAPAGVELPKRLWDRPFTNNNRNGMQIPAQISAILANNDVIDNY